MSESAGVAENKFQDVDCGSAEDYSSWTREDLIEKIRKLAVHVKQLRNVVRRDAGEDESRHFKKARRQREFDFSKHPKRHVALQIAYLGWDYQGLAVQEDTDKTIESHLFDALTKSKLIAGRSTSNYHRCGRTDKGVSGFGQVISIDLRCKCNTGKGVITDHCDQAWLKSQKSCSSLQDEVDYCKILNAILPKAIRVIAWAPVEPEFSSRFDCTERVYRYFMPVGNADIEAMRTAGSYLIGEHDFQNFCKADNSCEKSTIRRIHSFTISKCIKSDSTGESIYDVYVIEIRGQSFLWHQIRCIVAVLILVGKGLEDSEVVQTLLDLEVTPKKPQYSMATDYPLVLFETFHGDKIENWIYNPANIYHVMADLQAAWSQHALKAEMVRAMLNSLEALSHAEDKLWIPSTPPTYKIPQQHLESLIMGTKMKVYKSLADRPVCANTRNVFGNAVKE